MPKIIPIKELKKTSEISEMCHEADGPIYITKNGYGDMVIMSMESYQNTVCKPAFTTVRRYSKIKYVQKGLWTPGAVLHVAES